MTEEQEREISALFIAAQGADRDAYSRCLAALAVHLRRYVHSRVGDAAWVDDAVQEALVSIHAGRHTYDPARPFAPWFYAIARSRFIDVHRRESRRRMREVAWGSRPDPAVRESESSVDVDALRAAVNQLPARQRDVVVGLKYHEESVRAISLRTGLSESAVKVTAHRGYKALRRILGARSL